MTKKFLLVAAALATFVATPAFAQYPGSRPPPPPSAGYDHRGPSMDRRIARPKPKVQRRAARVCVTSRGSCPTQGFMVPGQNCRCHFPGFGTKRGNAR